MLIRLLGPVGVERDDGTVVPAPGRVAAGVLSFLALAEGRQVSTDALVDAVWDLAPDSARNALQVAVSKLRRLYGPDLIESGPGGYLLPSALVRIDSSEARRLARDAEAALNQQRAQQALEDVERALALFHGDAFTGWHSTTADTCRLHVEELNTSLRLLEGRCRTAAGEPARAVDVLRPLADEQPLGDAVHAALMEALAASGRPGDALSVYDRFRRQLADELGADPSPALQELFARLLAGGDTSTGPHAPRSVPPPGPTHLPVTASPLFGREADGSAVMTALEAGHLQGELRAVAVENLAEVELARGRHDRVVTEFGPLVRQFPYRERLRAAVMTGLYRQGRAADALELYRSGQAVLAEELGLDPGPELRALQAAILAEDPRLVVAAPRARDLGAVPPPAPATPLLGRAEEVAAVAGLVADPAVRLVSVLGPGGTGKTRLVLEVANHPPDPFAGAVVWVSLIGSDDPGLVLPTVGAALRLPAKRVGVAEVAAAVAGGPVLLVVDNLEHLLPGAADVVTELLAGCPELTILTTSRVAARAAGEHRFALGSLPVPDPENPATGDPSITTAESGSAVLEAVRDNPAVALFTARAGQVRPGFDLDADNAGAVAGICARLDGLPLALELAAARVGVLEPATMLARLESRLNLLTAAGGKVDGRHQSLRATLDWSHRLLSPAGAWLLAVLSVCRSGFTLPAVEDVLRRLDPGSDNPAQIADDAEGVWVVNTFQELVDASLVIPDPRADGEAGGRFRMLETIIEYAAEKLAATGHEPAARQAHCAHYRHATTSRWASAPLPPRTIIEADWYLAEQDNLRSAIVWAQTTGDHAAFADLVTTTAGHWDVTGNWDDVEHWLQAVADHPEAGIRRCDAEYWLADGAWARGSLADALLHADRAVQEAHHHTEVDLGRQVVALSHRGFMRHCAGMAEDCRTDCEASLALVPEVDDLTIQATALDFASAAWWLDDHRAAARDLLLRAHETAIRAGDDHMRFRALNDLADLALAAGDGAEALHWCSEAERLEITSRQPSASSYILSMKSGAFLLSGDLARARATLRKSLPLAARTSQLRNVAEGALFAAAVAVTGDAREAAVLLGSHEELLRTMGQQRIDSSVTVYDRHLADLDQRLDAATLHACLERGARLSIVELVDWLSNDQAPAMDSATLPASVTSR